MVSNGKVTLKYQIKELRGNVANGQAEQKLGFLSIVLSFYYQLGKMIMSA